MSDPVVVDGLTVRGSSGQELLEPTTFRIAAGRVTALTGPSGSGKTTLMRALLGHLPVGASKVAGSARVAGRDVFALSPVALRRFRREQIAYVGQDPGSSLNPLMRVRGLLHEVSRSSTETMLETLELVGLSAAHLRRHPGELSGGQQRRVALARALIRNTGILVLDEPLAGLHGSLRTEIARLLADIANQRSAAILLSGHDTAAVHAIADNVVELGTVHPEGLRPLALPLDGKAAVTCATRNGMDGRSRSVAIDSHSTTSVAEGQSDAPAAAGASLVEEAAGRSGAVPIGERPAPIDTGDRPEVLSMQCCPTSRAAAEWDGCTEQVPLGGPPGDVPILHDQSVEEAVACGSAGDCAEALAAKLESTESLLRVRNIGATIDGHEVLADIHFALTAGSALAVVGASGAGKTTLARVIAGLHHSTTGSLELRGEVIPIGSGRRSRHTGKGIQLVTQNPRSALNPRRTVAQTLGRPLRRFGGVPKRQLPQHISDLLAAVELKPEFASRYPHQLSGGQRQRVALARALAAEPAVLICDEITSALDHKTAISIMTLLDHIRAEFDTGLLVITHDMSLVAGHCADLVVLDHGRIVESGAVAEILAAPSHTATRELLG